MRQLDKCEVVLSCLLAVTEQIAELALFKGHKKPEKKTERLKQKRPAYPKPERVRTETAQRPKIAGPEHH